MIANINAAAEPPDPGLKGNRSATAPPAPGQSGSTAASAINNVLVEGLLGRANDLSQSAPSQSEDIGGEESADQYTQYARASILERSASAMAVQANQLPQTVLQLLQ
jgi:flagellin-like hook-associated protein FlgL